MAEEKYIVFNLDAQRYGIRLSRINGIEQNCEIVRVPKGGQFIKGIVYLRNEIIPVYDLKKRLGDGAEITKNGNQLLIADIDGIKIGFETDEVIGILPVADEDIKEIPQVISNKDTEYLENIIKVTYADNKKWEIIISIDVDGLISENEMSTIREVIEESAEE